MDSSSRRVDPVFVEFQLAVAGRYSIERELGRGGMGIVYLARDVQLDRLVAIKLLPPERALDTALRDRFLREARMAAKLSHPNIIPIFAVDDADGFVFYVMAYVDGETLGDRVRARGPMSASDASRVLREVAWALGYAHAQGLIHRDVKPENILLERGSGRALVTDFGIAAAIGADEERSVAGTPEYMSPEQALGQELDARSDLYGLGATAYFVVSGRPPFSGDRPVDVLAKQVASPVPALGGTGANVPRRLGQVIERCLAKSPADRPQDAQRLAEQLESAIETKREIPAALRGFVKRDARFLGPGTLLVAYFAVAGGVGLVVELGVLAGLSIVSGILLGIPAVGMVVGARRMLRLGYDQADIGLAFRHEIGQLREEFIASGRTERLGAERLATSVAAGGGIAMLAGMVANAALSATDSVVMSTGAAGWVMSLGGLTAMGGLITRTALRRRRPQASAERWARLWTGRIGRAAFALARRLGGRPVEGASTTHRATEMAIGMAADELFASLPRATQSALGDVPTVVAALQRDATELRAALDRLDESLADVSDAGSGDAYAELRAVRDQVAERHRQVIAALETTRLNLLRLHAGAIKVDGFTSHFEQAGEISTEVRRLLEARGELERFLRFPAQPRETPA